MRPDYSTTEERCIEPVKSDSYPPIHSPLNSNHISAYLNRRGEETAGVSRCACTGEYFARYLREAWKVRHRDEPPEDFVVCVRFGKGKFLLIR